MDADTGSLEPPIHFGEAPRTPREGLQFLEVGLASSVIACSKVHPFIDGCESVWCGSDSTSWWILKKRVNLSRGPLSLPPVRITSASICRYWGVAAVDVCQVAESIRMVSSGGLNPTCGWGGSLLGRVRNIPIARAVRSGIRYVGKGYAVPGVQGTNCALWVGEGSACLPPYPGTKLYGLRSLTHGRKRESSD